MSRKCYFISEQVALFPSPYSRRRQSTRSSDDSDDEDCQAAGLARRLSIASIEVCTGFVFCLSQNLVIISPVLLDL